ncbi:MAG: BrnT family toxin [Alphaproteobacteria bacterium]|nr:BrnT family toxin [Alphaproteobacteria bacterium]
MKSEFDPEKDAANRVKHGLSLGFGARVLADPDRLELLDVRCDYAEDRFIAYGKVQGRVYVCVFTLRGRTCRIISVRKANDRETSRYHKTPR